MTIERLDDDECNRLRALPCSFNDMLREAFGYGWHRATAWIPCSERMPDDEAHVLVYCDNGSVHTDWVDKDTGDFLTSPTTRHQSGYFATHWRPALPDPIQP